MWFASPLCLLLDSVYYLYGILNLHGALQSMRGWVLSLRSLYQIVVGGRDRRQTQRLTGQTTQMRQPYVLRYQSFHEVFCVFVVILFLQLFFVTFVTYHICTYDFAHIHLFRVSVNKLNRLLFTLVTSAQWHVLSFWAQSTPRGKMVEAYSFCSFPSHFFHTCRRQWQ